MLIDNQIIETTWSTSNKKWFESKGYKYTKIRSPLSVRAEDLCPTSKIMVSVKCDYCGNSYATQFSSYYKGINGKIPKNSCRNCNISKTWETWCANNIDSIFEKLQDICSNKGYTLLTNKEQYVNMKMNIQFICHKHGVQQMNISNFLSGHNCIQCSYEERGDQKKKTADEIKEIIESKNNNILLNVEEYKNSQASNLRILCGCCGKNIFTTSLANYKIVDRCRICSKAESVGEVNVRHYLEKYNIRYIPEKRYPDCKDKKTLPFDFYLPDYNMIIEFDGEGHFFQIFDKKSFEDTQRRDRIKNTYCENNNITLLRIPYWQRFNEENIINWFFEQHNINIGKRYDLVSQETMRDN